MSPLFKTTASSGDEGTRAPRVDAIRVERWLVERIAAMVELEPGDIDVTIPFEHYGLDSRSVTSMAGELEEALGFELPATLLWDYPTIAEVATFLAAEYAHGDQAHG